MSNNGIPPLNDWQEDNYPVIYDEGNETSYYVKNGNKNEIASGSLGYSVYVANLTQSGTSNPTVAEYQNTFGECVWTRNSEGDYRGDFTSDVDFSIDDVWINGTVTRFSTAADFKPIYNYSGVVGYYRLTPEVNAGHFRLYLEVYDGTWTEADISTLLGTNDNTISLPEIRVYP